MKREILSRIFVMFVILTMGSCSIFRNQDIDINQAVDNQVLTFSFDGDGVWQGSSESGAVDDDAAKSPRILADQFASMYTVADITSVSFSWKVSSEYNYDGLLFAIDGTVVDLISGETGWIQRSFSVSAGTHVLEWVYIKDVNGDVGQDCGWVDNIQVVLVDQTPVTNNTNTVVIKRGEWLFNGNVNDTSGNNNHGTIYGSAYLTNDRFGNINSAYYFDGSDDYIRIYDIGNNPTGSIEAWFKPADNTALYDQIFSQTENFQLTLNNGNIMWRINDTGAGNYDSISSTWKVNNGEWYHVVGTWDGNYTRLYINGVQVQITPFTNPVAASSSYAYIGRWGQSSSYLFDGIIDELTVYDNALGAGQIYDRYTNSTGQASEDNISPLISISSPSSGSDFVINQSIQIQGTSYDYFGVGSVSVFSDHETNTLLTGLSTWSTSLSFDTPGTYDIYAVAIDLSNNISITNTISVDVTNSNQISVTITSPAEGSEFIVGQNINIAGTSSDIFSLDSIYVYSAYDTNVLTSSLDNWNSSLSFSTAGTYMIYAVAENVINQLSATNTIMVQITNSNTLVFVDFNEAVDNLGLTFIDAGDASWYGQTNDAFYDGDSARSGEITHSESSEFETSINFTNEAMLHFNWKVSSESSFDYLRFYIDGSQVDFISGNVAWTQKGFTVSPGMHTLSWRYTKDGSVDNGLDCGWVDHIFYTNTFDIVITNTNTSVIKRGEWLLDGDVNDTSGNNNHGIISGAPYLTNDRFGNPNSAYYFDGVDDYIQLPSIGNNTTGSMEMWFRPAENVDNYDQIFSQTENFQISLYYGEIMWRINSTGGGSYTQYIHPGDVTLGNWYHIVGTWDGNYTHCYINGELIESIAIGSPIAPTGIYSYLGRWGQSSTQHQYKGSIDKFVVYDNALGTEQVYALYTNTAP